MGKFLIISEGGDGTGLALRLQEEGHECQIWIRDPEAEGRCTGLITHAKDYRFGETIVADCTGAGVLMDSFREDGRRTVGGSSFADKLECDRAFATQVMKKCGIRTPESHSFTKWEDAVEYANTKDKKDRLVFKPEGKLSGVVPSYVSYDRDDLLQNIEHFKSTFGSTSEPEFTIQQFVEGVAISTEGWFDGKKWVLPFNQTIERKHLMVGDLGPSGGCSGNLVYPIDVDNPILVDGLLRLEPVLEENMYTGAIDLNTVVNEDGIWALEFTPRFGYDAFPTLLYGLYDGDFGYFLDSLARHDGDDEMEIVDSFAAGVRVSIPPWPTEKFHAEQGVPLRGLSKESRKWFYPYDIESRDGELFSSGGYGIIGVVNGRGDTIDEAFSSAYKILDKLKLPDKQYRNDLAEVCRKDLRKINSYA